MTKSISLVLMRTESLLVKLSVNLLDGKDTNAVYSIYETDMYDYITVNLAAYVVFQYKPKLDGGNLPWDPSRNVRVNEMAMFTLLRGLKSFYSLYQREDLFIYYKSGIIECNGEEDDKVMIQLPGMQFIELTPEVIIDPTTNTPLPGVIMKLNMHDNKIQLSSDEFEALMYKLNKIDVSSMALQLVSLAETIEKDGKQINSNSSSPKKRPMQNIFQKREEIIKEDYVIDKRDTPLASPPSSLDEL